MSGPMCSLSQALGVVGERWTFQILREALAGTERFADFRATLRIASDVLSHRLSTLVDGGVLERREYREPGQRARQSYHLTEAGRELALVLAALEQWGDCHAAHPFPPVVAFSGPDERPVRVAFVDPDGSEVDPAEVRLERTPAHWAAAL